MRVTTSSVCRLSSWSMVRTHQGTSVNARPELGFQVSPGAFFLAARLAGGKRALNSSLSIHSSSFELHQLDAPKLIPLHTSIPSKKKRQTPQPASTRRLKAKPPTITLHPDEPKTASRRTLFQFRLGIKTYLIIVLASFRKIFRRSTHRLKAVVQRVPSPAPSTATV